MATSKYFKKKNRKTKIKTFLAGLLTGIISLVGIFYLYQNNFDFDINTLYDWLNIKSTTVSSAQDEMAVHFIDVGQGDSILITTPDQTILIDGGENDQADTVVNYLKQQNIEIIDLVIATHPHSDHIGGLDVVINTFEVKQVYMPQIPSSLTPTSKTYEDLLIAIDNKDLSIQTPSVGQQYSFTGGKLYFLAPSSTSYKDLNNYSISVKLVYGNHSFIMTGDAEKASEKDMLTCGVSLSADVLKAGHHGSSTSTSDEFLDAVNPTYTVISCGANNSYGHPTQSILDKLSKQESTILRTDLSGSIVFITNGVELNVYTQR